MTETTKEFFEAFSKAQAEFPPVSKNKSYVLGGKPIKYADLESIISAIRPVLSKYGFSFTQRVNPEASGAFIAVETVILFKDGSSMSNGFTSVPCDGSGRNRAQEFGSALTYARRYSLCTAFGITAEDDDDGVGAGGDHRGGSHRSGAEQNRMTPAALLKRAKEEAEKGNYHNWFKSLTRPQKTTLVHENNEKHEEFKKISKEHGDNIE